MKRFVLAALIAAALVLASGQAAQAHGGGIYTYPGHISLSGGLSLSWGAFGIGHGSPSCYGAPSHGGYAAPMPYNHGYYPMDYGYGHGYGHSYGHDYHGYYGY